MHDFHDVKENFERVLFLKAGRVAYMGSVTEAFETDRLMDVFGVSI